MTKSLKRMNSFLSTPVANISRNFYSLMYLRGWPRCSCQAATLLISVGRGDTSFCFSSQTDHSSNFPCLRKIFWPSTWSLQCSSRYAKTDHSVLLWKCWAFPAGTAPKILQDIEDRIEPDWVQSCEGRWFGKSVVSSLFEPSYWDW